MRRVILLLAACAGMAVVACSSAPPKTDAVNDVKNAASDATDNGNRYYHEGRWDLALRFFTQALDSNTLVDNLDGVIQSYNSLAKVYMAMGETGIAEQTLMKALPLSKTEGKEAMFFLTSDNLGQLYLQAGDPQKAILYFEQALALPSGKLSQTQTAVLYHDMGSAYKSTGDYARAKELFDKSLAINLAAKLGEETAADYYMIASLYSKQDDYSNADKNLQLALSYDKKVENSPGIALDLYALGLIAEKRSDQATAYDYFRRSYLVFSTLGFTDETRKALAKLIAATDALGNTEESAGYRKTLADMGT
jgi:tetratricopeptide (TPR) repeat protein